MCKILFSLFIFSFAIAQQFSVSNIISEPVIFIKHNGYEKYQNYLAMNLSYLPLNALRKQIELRYSLILRNRGEAHITVITPPEFDQFLQGKISIAQIDSIAIKNQIQQAKFTIIGLGIGRNYRIYEKRSTPKHK